MEDGLYKVQFQTQNGEGAGVAVLHNGKIQGGDASMYYIGTYQADAGTITAQVSIAPHSPEPNPVFGAQHVTVSASGMAHGREASLQGTAAEAPGVTLTVTMSPLPA